MGVSDLKLTDEELSSAQCLLEPLLVARVVWEGTVGYKEEVRKNNVEFNAMFGATPEDAWPDGDVEDILKKKKLVSTAAHFVKRNEKPYLQSWAHNNIVATT